MPANTIEFPNLNHAQYILAQPNADPVEVIKQLGLTQPQAVILIAGGAGSLNARLYRKLQPLFSRGIAAAALSSKALVIDGGTDAGVMKLMGQGMADRRAGLPVKIEDKNIPPILVGLAPYAQVTFPNDPDEETKRSGLSSPSEPLAQLEPNHSHFVLVQDKENKEWGCETSLMYRMARAFADGLAPVPEGETPGKKCKAVLVLAGGNPTGVTRDEALQAVRNRWQIIVIAGSGGLADQVARLKQRQITRKIRAEKEGYRLLRNLLPTPSRSERITDPFLAEIVEDGKLTLFPIGNPPDTLQRLIANQLRLLPENLLRLAWDRFALYDLNAARQQKTYMPLKNWPLILGIISTFLVIVHQVIYPAPHPAGLTWPFGKTDFWSLLLEDFFHLFIIAAPILISSILAAERRIKPGSKWIFLRDAAELIKRAIYHLRVFKLHEQDHLLENTDNNPDVAKALRRLKNRIPTRESEMVDMMERINSQLMQSDVKESALIPYSGPIPPIMYGAAGEDDGFSPLTPDEYIKIIVNDQISFYRSRTNQKEGQLMFYQILIWVFGGLGTLLAAFGQQIWLPLTTAFVTAFTAWLDYQMVQETLIKYNHAETRLSNILNWWKSLGADQSRPENILRLMDQVEDTLKGEVRGWVQHMHEAMADEDESDQGEPKPAQAAKQGADRTNSSGKSDAASEATQMDTTVSEAADPNVNPPDSTSGETP